MPYARRYIPSISLLAAFEATARLGSVTLAARELDLTQSAVSRQIKGLEDQLQVQLFVRDRQTIRPTSAGAAYADEVRTALDRISSASLNLYANPGGGMLNLAILPTFGTRWLAPRLPGFLNAHPGITINLVTRIAYFDFRTEPVDAAIHFGLPDWPGGEMVLLRSEQVLPVCSPALKAEFTFAGPADLRQAPLLHLTTRPQAWNRWFVAQGVTESHVVGAHFDQFATAAQAAAAGLGIGLLPSFLIEDELASGKLVVVLDAPYESAEKYYLVWPEGRSSYPPLASFKSWLVAEAQRS